MGEMLHYFIVSSEKDFLFYKKHYKDAFFNIDSLLKIIIRSLQIKRYIEKMSLIKTLDKFLIMVIHLDMLSNH